MKNFMQKVAEFKLLFAIIWIGMLAMYIVSKTLLGVYQVSFLTIIELILAAVVVGLIKLLFESKQVTKTHSKGMIIFEQYLFISIVMLGFNQLFQFYEVEGIQYLYLQAFITFSYFGALLGFYIMDYFELDILNKKLNIFKNSEKK